ncbi:MAG: response regulator [Selenomonas sp.]|uniref:hybrid sensor histidine kinase/response regulator n=1 Tax=Selenomonas sp. TaxID=2053611 RepID=UPI0025E14B10|nr:ATP-binding protein [Selenomonas sp.]MCR5438044.1 response regulator [Selenomonas sp.]
MNDTNKGNEIAPAMKREYLDALLALAEEYAATYRINLADGTMECLSTANVLGECTTKKAQGDADYESAMKEYVEAKVHPLEQLRVRAMASLSVVRKKLKAEHSYTFRFTLLLEGKVRFGEMKFVGVDPVKGEAGAVVLGIRLRDQDIATTIVNKQLIKEYDAVYFCDLNAGNIRIFRAPEGFEDKNGTTVPYQLVMDKIVTRVKPKYQEVWKNLANPLFVKDFIGGSQRREYIYELAGKKSIWRRALFQVHDRGEDGKATRIILSFIGIDYNQAKELEMTKLINEQNHELALQHEQLELALQQANSANQAKTDFLTNMSHDIRTPMNAIMGYTALAAAHIEEVGRVREYLDKIATASNHLLSLINDVLDMSRIESGRMNLGESETDLQDVVKEIHNILQLDVQAHQLEFTVDMDGIKNTKIMCDYLRLKQVLLNCLSNSVKFTKPGGKVALEISQHAQAPAGYASFTFSVRDTGIGMDPKFLSHLFEPFTRERTSTVSKTEGTGLGMAIVKNIVDMMGGDISVWSELGTGTEITMNFLFKLVDDSQAPPSTAGDEDEIIVPVGSKINGAYIEMPTLGGNKLDNSSEVLNREKIQGRVLLVEDNEINAEIVFALLEGTGIELELATNGAEAVDMVTNAGDYGYGLILMDLQMPLMNGLEATKMIRSMKTEWTKKVPIVAMTANAFDEDRKAAKESGMNDYILKPIDLPSLFQKLHEYLD